MKANLPGSTVSELHDCEDMNSDELADNLPMSYT